MVIKLKQNIVAELKKIILERDSHSSKTQGMSTLCGSKIIPSYKLDKPIEDIGKIAGKKRYSFMSKNSCKLVWNPISRFSYLTYVGELQTKSEEIYIFDSNSLVATAKFKIYKNPSSIVHIDDFVCVCDEDSQESYEFAEVLRITLAKGKRKLILEGECFVEFEELRVTEEYKGSRLWIEPVNKFIDKRFSHEDFTFMLIHAFPMEYSNLLTEELPRKNKIQFKKRLNAMKRLYSRNLHAMPLARQDWLFRRL